VTAAAAACCWSLVTAVLLPPEGSCQPLPAFDSFEAVTVHTALPDALTVAADEVLAGAGVRHVAHGDGDPGAAGVAAAEDSSALALIGPYRSRGVAEAVEATALAARDTVVAERIATALRATGRHAVLVAGDHDYGRQLAGQLGLAELPRARHRGEADVVVLAGLAGEEEIGEAADLSPLPVVAFDGVQGAHLGAGREIHLALPLAPEPALPLEALMAGAGQVRRAAELIVASLQAGARDRATMLAEIRVRGPLDDHGDTVDPPVWLWHARDDWTLEPDRAI
jgi:hypothetical protein